DLVEIRRISEAEKQENLDFRRYLKGRRRSEEAFHILASEVQERIDCTVCANCCRELWVNISAEEIGSIAEWLRMRTEDVVQLYTEPDPENAGRRLLRHVEGDCVFLDRNLCMIYEARPAACRDFPYVRLPRTTLGGRMASQFRRMAVCPIVFNAVQAYKQQLGFRRAAD